MSFKKCGICFGGAMVFFCSLVFAQEKIYHSKSSEMIDELTRQPVMYRSFVPSKKRAIKVVQRINKKVEETTIMVDTKADVPKLKVKIEFDVNSATLKTSSYALLREVGKALKADGVRQKVIMINGHTDSDGSEAHNLQLSFERAEAVKTFLAGIYEISEERLKIRGYGEKLPLRPNNSYANKKINRRVEFEIAK